MGKPTLHYGKYRIRWTGPDGNRKSACYDTYKEAELANAARLLESAGITYPPMSA